MTRRRKINSKQPGADNARPGFNEETFGAEFMDLPLSLKHSVRKTLSAFAEKFFLERSPRPPVVEIKIILSSSNCGYLRPGLKLLWNSNVVKSYEQVRNSPYVFNGVTLFVDVVVIFLDSSAFGLSRKTVILLMGLPQFKSGMEDPSTLASGESAGSPTFTVIPPEPRQTKRTTADKHRFIFNHYVESTGGARAVGAMHMKACAATWKALEDESYCQPGEAKRDFQANTIRRIVSQMRSSLKSKNYSDGKTSPKSKTK